MSCETYVSGLELSKASQSHRRISSSWKLRHALPKTLNNVRFTMRISVSHQPVGELNFHSILSRLLNSLSSFQFKDSNAFWHPVKLLSLVIRVNRCRSSTSCYGSKTNLLTTGCLPGNSMGYRKFSVSSRSVILVFTLMTSL